MIDAKVSGQAAAVAGAANQPINELAGSDGPSGQMVRDYRLLSKLGEGGMGVVYKAHEIGLDRDVALKMLSPKLTGDTEYVQRFYREARMALKLDDDPTHCIVRGYAVFEERGAHYFAMEFIDGENLEKRLKRQGHLNVGDAVRIAIEIGEALDYAHSLAKPIYHRDIKPSNIMITVDGKVKLTDLGLAKAAGDDMGLTQLGTMAGTFAYMPPEQARNATLVDGRSDLYALGVTLYVLLAGAKPFTGRTDLEILEAKETGRFAPASRLNPEVPAVLDRILAKMMAPEPSQRYQTAGEAATALAATGLANATLNRDESDGDGPTIVDKPLSTPHGAPPSSRRTPILVAAAGATLACGIVLAWMMTHQTQQTQPPQRGTAADSEPSPVQPAVPAEPIDMILSRAIDEASQSDVAAATQTLTRGLQAHPDNPQVMRPLRELERGALILFQYQTPEETSPIEPLWNAEGVTLTRRDNYRFGILPGRDCYVYAYQRDTRPSVTTIFPNPRYSPQMNPLPARQLTWLPSNAGGETRSWMHLDTAIGEERFYFVALASALRDPDAFGEQLIDDATGQSADLQRRLELFVKGGPPAVPCFAYDRQAIQVFRFNHK